MNTSTDMVVDQDIGSVVSALRADGVETVGPRIAQGKTPEHPSIRFQGGMEILLRAMKLVQDLGLAVLNVGLYYSTGGSLMLGPWWEMTFTANVAWPMLTSDL
jgi:hypothetical protein